MTRQGEGVCLCSEGGCIARPTMEGVFMASEDTGQHMRGQGVRRGQCWGVRKGLGVAVGRAGAKGCKSVRLPWGRDGGGGGVAGAPLRQAGSVGPPGAAWWQARVGVGSDSPGLGLHSPRGPS